MKERLTEQEALKLIDGICLCYEDCIQNQKNAELCLDEIYRVAHSHTQRTCYSSHDDWRKESVHMLKKYKKLGMC